MPGFANRYRLPLWRSLLGLALLPLFSRSCGKVPQPSPIPAPPPPPPPPSLIEQADRSFESADYPGAATAYSNYLTQNPDGAQRDRALYRLGMIYALPDYPARDTSQSVAYLKELAADFPASTLRPQAELFVDLEERIAQLNTDVTERERQLAALNQQVAQLKTQAGTIAQLQEDLKNREERIRQLNDELQKLKAIDLGRHPTPPAR
jgi:uncharacterized coiled-coil protein SlyX